MLNDLAWLDNDWNMSFVVGQVLKAPNNLVSIFIVNIYQNKITKSDLFKIQAQ